MKKPELLIPAGNLERLKTAILYGADAVYLGTPDMSLRSKSGFGLEDVVEGIAYAHSYGKKAYLTLNLFSHNKDVEKLPEIIKTIQSVKPDGLIISDPGVFDLVKSMAPELELHISTQANVCSYLTVNFWQKQGASLVVLAREVSFDELKEIREKSPNIKLEVFVHGSMCMTYSGRCLLSNFLAERGANQGSCAHSCRWGYKLKMKLKDGGEHEIEINENNKDLFDFFLEEEVRPGQLLPFEEDVSGSYILNSKDLCLMPKLDEYIKLGVDSLKVEGRNKTEYYVGSIARIYRTAIDDYFENPDKWNPRKYMDELNAIASRGYTLAFHDGRLTNLAHDYQSTASTGFYEYAGKVVRVEDDAIIVEVKNRLDAGDVLEFLSPFRKEPILLRMYKFFNIKKNQEVEVMHAGQKPEIRIPLSLFHLEDPSEILNALPPLTIIRKVKLLEQSEILKIQTRNLSYKLELGDVKESKYADKKEEYLESFNAEEEISVPKSHKIGAEGCCGAGCNGCLIFWHDDKYAKARELLKTKKLGKMLQKSEISATVS